MKKLVPTALVLIALAVAALVFFQHETPHRPRAAEIAPAEALFFAQLPDVRRSVRRWPETALARLWLEPEMQTFLEMPRQKMPLFVRARETLARLERVAPREAFVAVTSLRGATPEFVAGFAYSGGQGEAAALMAEARTAWKKAWPAGRTELSNYGGCEIETYSAEGQVVAECFHAGWYLVASHPDALKTALDRCDGKAGAGLAGTEDFRQSTAALPADLDGVIFAQLGAWMESGGNLPTLAWGTKIEGAQMRDTIFLKGAGTAGPPLQRGTQALNTADTLFYAALALPERAELTEAVSAVLGLMGPALGTLETELARRRLTWAEFGAAFGPEVGSVLDWPEQADAPAAVFALAVRDAAKARSFVETLTDPALGGVNWTREQSNGAIFYTAPVAESAGASPGIALSERFAVLAGSAASAREGLARLSGGGAASEGVASFQTIAGQMREPTAGFARLDLRALFERSYATLRPFLAMSLAFSPETSQYLDASKLPSTEAIARHLGPTIYSQSATGQGTLIESAGTFTLSQTLAGVLAGGWTSVGPVFEGLGKKDAGSDPTIPTSRPDPPAPPPTIAPATPANFSQTPADPVATRPGAPSQP